jgi:molybdopterin converting factor small subunit
LEESPPRCKLRQENETLPTIVMPPAWKVIAAGQRAFECQAASVGDALAALFEQFPALRERVLDERDEVVSYVSVFVGDDDIRNLEGTRTLVTEDTTISIIPAIVGG